MIGEVTMTPVVLLELSSGFWQRDTGFVRRGSGFSYPSIGEKRLQARQSAETRAAFNGVYLYRQLGTRKNKPGA